MRNPALFSEYQGISVINKAVRTPKEEETAINNTKANIRNHKRDITAFLLQKTLHTTTKA